MLLIEKERSTRTTRYRITKSPQIGKIKYLFFRQLGFKEGAIRTRGYVIESDAGAGERLLHRRRDAIRVAVGRDRDWTTVVQFGKRGTDIPSDGMWIAALRDLTVLDVPPHRRLRRHVLRLSGERGRTRRYVSVSIPSHRLR